MSVHLRGVVAPVVTPFDASTGEIAAGEFGANVAAHLDAGLAGVLVAGSTGEAATLTPAEQRRVERAADREKALKAKARAKAKTVRPVKAVKKKAVKKAAKVKRR